MIRLIDERVMEKLRDKPENIDLEEFLPLVGEWREDKASKAKCPYCVEPIQKQATKCSHCLSEIEWFKFDGLYGPCKAGASEEMKGALSVAKATFLTQQASVTAAIIAENKAATFKNKIAEEELTELLSELVTRKCAKCSRPVFTSDKLETTDAKMLYEHPDYYNKCELCAKKSENVAVVIFVVVILLSLLLLANWR